MRRLFRPDVQATPVQAAVDHLRPVIADDPRQQELQYRALRDLVESAARREDAPYGLYVALHDRLLRDGVFRPPLDGADHLLLFDERFYLDLHEDIAAAVAAGQYADGFDHFVRCGAQEGRRPHPWRAALRLAPPAPARSAAEVEDRTLQRRVDLGHTFSGLIEQRSGYCTSHGHAVAIDMALSTAIGVALGTTAAPLLQRILCVLGAAGLPTDSPLLTVELCETAIAAACLHRGGSPNLVVPRAVGDCGFVTDRRVLTEAVLDAALRRLRASP